MAIISLGTVTIVGMFLWFLMSLLDSRLNMTAGKAGLLGMYLVAAAWTAGIL